LPHGRLTPSGIVTDTGIGGLTLGGGIGWTARRFGLTCDNLVSVRLITADGNLLLADDDRDPELMWALRGGCGGLGVVTDFEFDTHPFPREPVAGFVVHRLADATAALRHCRDFINDAPEEITFIVFLRLAPPVPWIPSSLHGQPVAMIGAVYAGPPDLGDAALAPIVSFGHPVAVTLRPTPFAAHQAVLDAANPAGHRYYWKSEQLAGLTDDVIDLLVEQGACLSSPVSLIGLFQIGGAVRRRSSEGSCFPNRDAELIVNYASHWLDPSEDDTHRTWTRHAHRQLSPHAFGAGYANFQADFEPTTLYGTVEYARLSALKGRLVSM
jgi:hypothetical protein